MYATNVTVIAKSGFGKFNYAFLVQTGGVKGQDVFILPKNMSTSGFEPNLLGNGTVLEIDIGEDAKGRLVVARVHSVDGQEPQPKTTPIFLDQFRNPSWPVKNEETGQTLWQILDPADNLVQYVIANGEGLVVRQLGHISSNEARATAGLPTKKARLRSRQETLPEHIAA
jgi:hypothetical protein